MTHENRDRLLELAGAMFALKCIAPDYHKEVFEKMHALLLAVLDDEREKRI